MTTRVEQERSISQTQHMRASLIHLSVTELIRTLRSLQALREELRLIPFAGDDADETLIITEELLQSWDDELDQILALEQAKNTFNHLCIWDNEGGSTN